MSETLEQRLAAIRAEYERSISDAYAGGPAGRERVWNRLLPLIDQYADAKAAAQQPDETDVASAGKHEDSSPILMSETAPATAQTAETEPPGPAKPPRAKPTARKATAS